MKLKKVTIIGAGWLGMPLAVKLLANNYHVMATKQSAEDINDCLAALKKNSIFSQQYAVMPFSDGLLNHNILDSGILQQLFTDRQIIITVPPTPFLRRHAMENQAEGIVDYANFIQNMAKIASDYQAESLIYTSSISVYGNSSGIINEELPAMPKTNSAKAIVAAEKSLQNNIIPVTILRLAGLIGHGRHPIFTLQGRDNIRSPLNAINLLHIEDLLQAIIVILNREKVSKSYDIYNLVTPCHPNRQSYYQALAQQLNLTEPIFETAQPELKKIIDGGKITNKGDFNYKVLDLIHSSLNEII